VVCPVDSWEDRYITETNKTGHYLKMHFSKDMRLPIYGPSMFAEMSPENHADYTHQTGIVLHTSPFFQRTLDKSIVELLHDLDVAYDDAVILMLHELLKKRGVNVRHLLTSFPNRRPATNAREVGKESFASSNVADEDEDFEEEAAPTPPPRSTPPPSPVVTRRKVAQSKKESEAASKKRQVRAV
jgi:hypothetical protein